MQGYIVSLFPFILARDRFMKQKTRKRNLMDTYISTEMTLLCYPLNTKMLRRFVGGVGGSVFYPEPATKTISAKWPAL